MSVRFALLLLLGLLQLVYCDLSLAGKGDYPQTGLASYYADRHHNKRTASGERYKSNAKTASHMTLPFGSRVKVTNVANGKSVVARVNDRGNFSRGRVIDLSKAAFRAIGNSRAGLLKVKLKVIR